MSSQAEAWAGEFGDEYTRRNRVGWRGRIPFWREILNLTSARSVYEFGCNAGWNLSAIKAASRHPSDRADDYRWDVETYGEDINESALIQAASAGLDAYPADDLLQPALMVDLSFTAGVLIHIAPQDLEATMQKVISFSADWVLAVEYADTEEVEVEYRGQKNMLWRRDYGRLYQDLGLELQLVAPAGGFDNCTAWLLRKR